MTQKEFNELPVVLKAAHVRAVLGLSAGGVRDLVRAEEEKVKRELAALGKPVPELPKRVAIALVVRRTPRSIWYSKREVARLAHLEYQ